MMTNIRIVLVETSHPGNIGAAARAMKTMNLSSLYLVAPQSFPSAEATARASGADDVLARATVCASLDQAVGDCTLVIGASARLRRLAWPQVTPGECARQLLQGAAQGPVALVFGRERNGLTNAELDRCHALVHIPTSSEYGSLNVAAAVQILAYELLQASAVVGAPSSPEPPARAEDMARFYEHLGSTLTGLGVLDPANPRQLMRRLRRLFNRARPDAVELQLLRGILTAVDKQRRGNESG